MTSVQQHSGFGRQTIPHTVIIARGDRVRHFTVKPWVLCLSTALASIVAIGSLGTGGYLLTRDDILASGSTSELRLERAYEERIASLRAQLDRAVSRQILDRQSVETKVDTLIGQQAELTARYEKLQPLLDRARATGVLSTSVPIPQQNPRDALTELGGPLEPAPSSPSAPAGALALASSATSPALARFGVVDRVPSGETLRPAASSAGAQEKSALPLGIIQMIGASIDSVEDGQIANLARLAESARDKAEHIADVLRSEGIVSRTSVAANATSAPATEGGEGGPMVEVPEAQLFDASFEELDRALTDLQLLQKQTDKLPLARPVDSLLVSSTYGVRSDPFLGRAALHTGMDLVAPTGADVDATASGTIVQAGPNGGYGNMVEVDHGGGIVTRYGHLSQVLVMAGDKVQAGALIGRVGTTGRSTGPHLHYEVRRDGSPVDPSRFLRAGRRIDSFG